MSQTLKIIVGIIVVLIILVISDILTIELHGCTLPIDLVIGNTCMLGSLGIQLGAVILLTIGYALVIFIWETIKQFLR